MKVFKFTNKKQNFKLYTDDMEASIACLSQGQDKLPPNSARV